MKILKLERLENGLIKVQYKNAFGRVVTRLVFHSYSTIYKYLDNGETVFHSGIEWFGLSNLKEVEL